MENEFGISTAPTTMRLVQVEGENADGVTVYEENVERTGGQPACLREPAPTSSGLGQMIAAMLGTRQGAAESGYQLLSTGVTVTDLAEAAALRDSRAHPGP